MKFVIVLAVCVAVAAAASSRGSDEETKDTTSSQEETSRSQEGSRQEDSEESRKKLVTRTERKKIDRHPDEIALLNGVQQCILCRETWGEALNSFNNEVNVDGAITADKTCRFACRAQAITKINQLEKAEKNELLCSACRIGVDFWRAQPSKKTHYQLAKDNMCKAFTNQITREDCEHTVRMYGFDIFTSIRNELSSSSICHTYNLCGRQATEFTWEEDAEEDMLEKDLQSVSLDELNPNYSSDRKSKSTETVDGETTKTDEKEEDGVSVSTERTRSEERERSLKERRERQREARRERRRQERKERHQSEREEQARRHAEELRVESSEE